ncbi:S8 family serine peptidase [Methanococcoides sp. NM1]|uniref:S8 family serine peptidase n=1 Tax=Methanococcoides sp. NM1 TaxID=1201013 RepID=UPI0014383A4A|nr:S8 family serine peptidase [Methanococcoides sp. NM1]
MDLHNWKLTVLTVCLLITGMIIPVSAFTPSVDAQYDIYEELTIDIPENDLYVPGEIIVKFAPGLSEEKIANINARNGAKVKYTSQHAGFKVLKIPENRNVEKMAEIYSKNPNVKYAVPNAIMTAFAVNDEYYNFQWNLYSNYSINVEPAWVETTGNGVVVAVLDTGVAYEDYRQYKVAPDLASTQFIAGYDFVNNDKHPNDDHSHGTHVAGTIAQSTNNGIGVAGVAYDCSIMPVKVLDKSGSGTLSELVDGIYFATDNGADVISMSLGYPPEYYPGKALDDALDHADINGVTIVAAAGNDATGVVSYPAAYEKCIAVGATGYNGQLAPYSNYGDAIDVVAPGGNTGQDLNSDGYGDGILQNTFNPTTKDPKDFGYYFFQGTSMATPHVSGVAALLMSQGASNDEVRTALESTARDLGTTGWDNVYGHGLIDATAALEYYDPITPPTPINNPPVADTGGPYDGVVGTAITFDGSGSSDLDEDATSLSYDWYFGDGSTGSGITPTHAYNSIGSYTVILNVTDSEGATNESTTVLSITDPNTPVEQMSIKSVAVTDFTRQAGKNTFVYAEAVVTIVDENQYPVEGATVSGQWSDSATDTDTGITDTSGEVTLTSDAAKYKGKPLTFIFTVNDVTHAVYEWDGETLPVTETYPQ